MLLLIVGRTGSGKDYMARKLVERGFKQVISYTTRPKRDENENTHIFITPDEAATYTDKVATTNINGYDYFATASQVAESNIYIVDPNGLYELVNNLPNETFYVLYVQAEDDERRIHAVKRAENKIKEEQIFEDRDAAENEQFSEFEERLRHLDAKDFDGISPNITKIYRFCNTYDVDETKKYIDFYESELRLHDKMTDIIAEVKEAGIVETSENGNVIVKHSDGTTTEVTTEHFADVVLGHDAWLGSLMREYLRLKSKV